MNAIHRPHVYVMLDRSGSMEAMREAVVDGFNGLLTDQQAEGPDALMTLVQFDSQAPHEILAEALPITEMVPLSAADFVPRGGTPLLDAIGRTVTLAGVRQDERAATGGPPEDITVITITDGQENQSREFTRAQIVGLVKDKTNQGWSFVFLGAGLDAYAEARGMGYDDRSVQAWAPDGSGAVLAMRSASAGISSKRAKLRRNDAFDKGDFFEGAKPAEADRARRDKGSGR